MAVTARSQRTQKGQVKDLTRMQNTKIKANKTWREMGGAERRLN